MKDFTKANSVHVFLIILIQLKKFFKQILAFHIHIYVLVYIKDIEHKSKVNVCNIRKFRFLESARKKL